ncbi:NAD-dependent epimerase [Chiayiivirga flava]|uniref:UDP-glucuronate 4-epimerase n=1 Tax=Chiayiivirga flava TaxID=659595 RepID=A0A7W8D8A5_9GAMM|nr:NAD-dependent epimerase [Chiayiivirga flava]MBB5209788.1 UDP-glucuronate 4-epimerase [Chiayiivirga flava]
MRVLVTGAAGFIGAATALRLLERGDRVFGYDNINDYYDPVLKHARLARLRPFDAFSFEKAALENRDALDDVFAQFKPERVVHLAAQAGVRYSIENPRAYIDSNLVGFANTLEACRRHAVEHLVYASSSSVYGGNRKLPFSVEDAVDHPLSLYAATKKANELMAHTYAHLYRLPVTGLRFFTVYGPWGRPDMAPYLFTQKILAGEPIEVFNNGRHSRDFTYIDDIVEGVVRVLDRVAKPDPRFNRAKPSPATSDAPYRIYNIGNSAPVELKRFIEAIEASTGRAAEKILRPMQAGDVEDTFADISALERDVGYAPGTSIEDGVERLVQWYREFHRV